MTISFLSNSRQPVTVIGLMVAPTSCPRIGRVVPSTSIPKLLYIIMLIFCQQGTSVLNLVHEKLDDAAARASLWLCHGNAEFGDRKGSELTASDTPGGCMRRAAFGLTGCASIGFRTVDTAEARCPDRAHGAFVRLFRIRLLSVLRQFLILCGFLLFLQLLQSLHVLFVPLPLHQTHHVSRQYSYLHEPVHYLIVGLHRPR